MALSGEFLHEILARWCLVGLAVSRGQLTLREKGVMLELVLVYCLLWAARERDPFRGIWLLETGVLSAES